MQLKGTYKQVDSYWCTISSGYILLISDKNMDANNIVLNIKDFPVDLGVMSDEEVEADEETYNAAELLQESEQVGLDK